MTVLLLRITIVDGVNTLTNHVEFVWLPGFSYASASAGHSTLTFVLDRSPFKRAVLDMFTPVQHCHRVSNCLTTHLSVAVHFVSGLCVVW